jgi:phosphate transport system protein
LSASQQEEKQDARDINIDAKGKNLELLKAEIVSSYLNGYDTINILFDNNSTEAPKIKDVIRNLSGLEIMEQTSTRIVAKNLININEISIGNIIRRMDIITRAMMEDAILCCRGQCNYDSIHHRDVDVNRLYFLSYRVIKNAMKNPRIAKSLGTEPWQLHSDTMMILRLEKIADRQKRIARYLCTANLDRATLAELDRIHTDISEAYNNVMKAYYNQDRQIAFNVEVTNRDKTALCDKLLEKYTNMHVNSKSKTANSNLVAVAKIVENLKATAVEVRNTARTVLCYE